MAEQQNGCSPSDCAGCAHADSCSSKPKDLREPANQYSHINKVIAVVSGKGGVGKSMVTASLARMMREQGFSVGILDADVTGPSIPKMYGIHGSAVGTEEGILPGEAKDGTKIMSVNLLLEHESDPVIWRGPIIAGVVKQFWTDVMWGELDYLFVDMPPGTGDVPLTVFQSPAGGRHRHRHIAPGSRADDRGEGVQYGEADEHPGARYRGELQLSRLPGLREEDPVFGESHIDDVAESLGVPVLGRMPVDPKLAEAVEEERFYEADNQYLADAVNKL